GQRSVVEYHGRCVVAGLVDPVDKLALVLGLPDVDVEAEFLPGPLAQVRQIGIGRGSVYRRLALAQAAEVRPVEHEHPAAPGLGAGCHEATAWYASVSSPSGGLSYMTGVP